MGDDMEDKKEKLKNLLEEAKPKKGRAPRRKLAAGANINVKENNGQIAGRDIYNVQIVAEKLCPESKEMALLTGLVALARTLARSGALDRGLFRAELDAAARWLSTHGSPHDAAAFSSLREMLDDV
jgi:hypothetical protein